MTKEDIHRIADEAGKTAVLIKQASDLAIKMGPLVDESLQQRENAREELEREFEEFAREATRLKESHAHADARWGTRITLQRAREWRHRAEGLSEWYRRFDALMREPIAPLREM